MLKYLLFSAILCIIVSTSYASLVRSKAALRHHGSFAVNSKEDFMTYPNLYDDVQTKLYGGYKSRYEGNISCDAQESFYANLNNVYTSLICYNDTNGAKEISRVYMDYGEGHQNGDFSYERKFAISSTTKALGPNPFNLTAPQDFELKMRGLVNGVLNQTPVNYNMKNIDPAFWFLTGAYNNLLCLSEDGKYALVSYSVFSTDTSCPYYPTPFCPGDNTRLAVLRINDDFSVDVVAIASVPAPNIPGNPYYQAFSQRGFMYKVDHGVYDIHVSLNSWFLPGFDLLGKSSRMGYYRLDLHTGSLDLLDTFWVPQFIENFDVDTKYDRVYVGLEAVTLHPNASIYMDPYAPYDNAAIDKESELQVLAVTECGYEYKGGEDFQEFITSVAVTRDGKKLAVTTASDIDNQYYISPTATTPIPSRRTAPNQVHTYSVFDNVKLNYEGTAPASSIAFGSAFNDDGSRFTSAGATYYTYFNTPLGFYESGQRGKIIYNVVKSK